jgi:hypothetical protein
MKTHRIELQKFKAATNSSQHGTVSFHIDCLISPQRPQEDKQPASELVMTEADARVLLVLLKKQIADFDSRKAKSRF